MRWRGALSREERGRGSTLREASSTLTVRLPATHQTQRVAMTQTSSGNGLVLMWSGGKDAMLTLNVLHSQSPRRVQALLATVVEEVETVTMHGTPLTLLRQQADLLGIPLHVMRVPPNASNATYEARLERTLGPLLAEGIRTVAAGDLFLEDVKAYRARVLRTLGATPMFPLWKRDTDWLARHFLERGYQAVVTSVDRTQLGAEFVGRRYDEAFLDALPDGVDPCGEHGEFHTFVIDGPPFECPIPVNIGDQHGEGRMRYARLRLAESGGETKNPNT